MVSSMGLSSCGSTALKKKPDMPPKTTLTVIMTIIRLIAQREVGRSQLRQALLRRLSLGSFALKALILSLSSKQKRLICLQAEIIFSRLLGRPLLFLNSPAPENYKQGAPNNYTSIKMGSIMGVRLVLV